MKRFLNSLTKIVKSNLNGAGCLVNYSKSFNNYSYLERDFDFFEKRFYSKTVLVTKKSDDLIQEVHYDNFGDEVLSTNVPVFVVFYTKYDVISNGLLKDLHEVAEEKYADKLKLVKVDVDSNPELIETIKVDIFPSIYIFYQDGFIGKIEEVPDKKDIDEIFSSIIEAINMKPEEGEEVDEALNKGIEMFDMATYFLQENDFEKAKEILNSITENEEYEFLFDEAYLALTSIELKENSTNEGLYKTKELLKKVKSENKKKQIQAFICIMEKFYEISKKVSELEKDEIEEDDQVFFDVLSNFTENNFEKAIEICLEQIKKNNKSYYKEIILNLFDFAGESEFIRKSRARLMNLL